MKVEVLEEGRKWQVYAPAKVNLYFEILGKRPDGYHEIETVAAPISLYDRLEFELLDGEGMTIECFNEDGTPDPEVPCDESNLVYKAYFSFRKKSNKFNAFASLHCIRCRIFKKIPTKAGLGGGSSDAAGTLAVLNVMSGSVISFEGLREIAGSVGSDVALFLEDGATIGRGRGERIEPIDLPSLWLVLLKPNAGLSTPAVYGKYASTSHGPRRSLEEFCSCVACASKTARTNKPLVFADAFEDSSAIARTIGKMIFNRLEEPAAELWDGFKTRRAALLSTNALGVQMSGSGTAFFAIYPDESSARLAADALVRHISESSAPDWKGERVFVAKTLSR